MNHLQVARLWVAGLLQAFEKLGLSARQLGVDMASFEGPRGGDHAVEHPAIETVRTLWHRATALSDNPLLGIEVARRQSSRTSGVLLPIMLHSPCALQALRHLIDYQPLLSDSGQFRLLPDDDTGSLRCEYLPTSSAVLVCSHQVLAIVAQTLGTLRHITNGELIVHRLDVPQGMDAARIGEALHCPCRAHAGPFCLHLDAEALHTAVPVRDGHLYEINLSYAEGLIRAKRQRQTFIDGIKAEIDGARPALAHLDQVARSLGLHKRVLQRHLREHHTSFRQIKMSVLKTRALHGLITEGWPGSRIAEDLGYTDLSAFHRAFKNWFGVSPKRFRDQPHR